MNEVDFIYENYKKYKLFTKEQIEFFLIVYQERIVRVYEDLELKGIAFYFKLDDETLDRITNRKLRLNNTNVVNKCFLQDGDNIHFFAVVADGANTIIKGLRVILNQNVKSVSWFSPDMHKFFIRRVSCRQLS